MRLLPFVVILLLAPLALGGLLHESRGEVGPASFLSMLAVLGIALAVSRIISDRRH